MQTPDYIHPEFEKGAFNCPHCHALAHQLWHDGYIFTDEIRHAAKYGTSLGDNTILQRTDIQFIDQLKPNILDGKEGNPHIFAKCQHCKKFSIWLNQKMIYPLVPTSPPPYEDMPDDVKKTYEEARQVQPYSARASAALLRIALEQLTEYLGETKGNLYTRIKNLEQKGLPDDVIKVLHIVRIYTNDEVHATRLIKQEDKDNQDIVSRLFKLVNIIVEKTISEKKEIDELLGNLPENKKEGIKNRDSDA